VGSSRRYAVGAPLQKIRPGSDEPGIPWFEEVEKEMFASMDSAQVWTVVGVLVAMAGFVMVASQRGQSSLEARLQGVENKIDNLDQRLETRIQGLETRFQGVETRFQGVENKIDNLDQRLETRIQGVEIQLVGLRGDVGRVEDKLDEHLAAHAHS
jgi:chromosome segregation ATPase